MNIRNSGKFPDKIKIFAALLAVTGILLSSGCSCVADPVVTPSSDVPGDTHDTSDTEDTSDSATSDSSNHVPETSDSTSFVESGNGSDASNSAGTDPSDSSGETSDTSDTSDMSGDNSSSSVQGSSEPPDVSSDITPSDSSSSSSEPVVPNPPPVVVIPTIKSPSSPGTAVSSGKNGSFDYSNASQGYISAKYTGSSKKVKLRISCGGNKQDFDVDPGVTEYFPLLFGSGTYTVTLFEQLEGQNYGSVTKQSFTAQMNPLSPFLYPNRYVNYSQSSNVVRVSAEVCAGKSGTIDKIAAIFKWVAENISYDQELATSVTTGYVPDPDRTLSKRKGICFDYSALMAAMLRAQDIPTRLIIGYASPNIYHAWNEVYTEETGWITPELLLKKAGYNLIDATFYSSAKDKAQIAEYISNGGNYSDAVRIY